MLMFHIQLRVVGSGWGDSVYPNHAGTQVDRTAIIFILKLAVTVQRKRERSVGYHHEN